MFITSFFLLPSFLIVHNEKQRARLNHRLCLIWKVQIIARFSFEINIVGWSDNGMTLQLWYIVTCTKLKKNNIVVKIYDNLKKYNKYVLIILRVFNKRKELDAFKIAETEKVTQLLTILITANDCMMNAWNF